ARAGANTMISTSTGQPEAQASLGSRIQLNCSEHEVLVPSVLVNVRDPTGSKEDRPVRRQVLDPDQEQGPSRVLRRFIREQSLVRILVERLELGVGEGAELALGTVQELGDLPNLVHLILAVLEHHS